MIEPTELVIAANRWIEDQIAFARKRPEIEHHERYDGLHRLVADAYAMGVNDGVGQQAARAQGEYIRRLDADAADAQARFERSRPQASGDKGRFGGRPAKGQALPPPPPPRRPPSGSGGEGSG